MGAKGLKWILFVSKIHMNDVCHANDVKFFAADVFGFYGYMFADLGEHKYVEYVNKSLLW